jgi:hypothetical protein
LLVACKNGAFDMHGLTVLHVGTDLLPTRKVPNAHGIKSPGQKAPPIVAETEVANHAGLEHWCVN